MQMIRLFNEPRPIKELIAEVLASLQPDEPKQSHKEFSEKYAVLKSIYYLKNNSQKVCKMKNECLYLQPNKILYATQKQIILLPF